MRRTALAALVLLAACRQQPEPVANRFDRTSAEILNMANELTAETDNQVRAVEADVQNQIEAIAANQADEAIPTQNLTNAAAPAANAAPGNRARR